MISSIPTVDSHLAVKITGKILEVRINREKQLNTMNDELENDIERVLNWAELEPSVWVIIITGTGSKAFCAGQDLKGWLNNSRAGVDQGERIFKRSNGFGSIARRISKKIYIAALNGNSYGGGSELLSNCDIVIGFEAMVVSFPEVRRGVTAGVGGIPNIASKAPMLLPYILAGIPIPMNLLRNHLLTTVVAGPDEVMEAAYKWANLICECSPEAVWVSKSQINLHNSGMGVREIIETSVRTEESINLYKGANLNEGLVAFQEKRDCVWSDPPRLKSKL